MNTTLDEIKKMIDELKVSMEDYINKRLVTAGQVSTLNGLSDISKNLGLIRSGEFRSGNNKEPGEGFSGVRIGHPGFSYAGEEWNIVGVNNDNLSFGISASDGSAKAAGGLVSIDEDGISITSGGVAFKLGGSFFIGSVAHGTSLARGIHNIQENNVYRFSDDFEAEEIDTENWTVTGTPYITSDVSNSGDYSVVVNKNNYITYPFTTIVGAEVLVTVIAQTQNNSRLKVDFTGAGSSEFGQTADVNPFSSDGYWTTYKIRAIASSTNMTVSLAGWTGTESVYIDDFSISYRSNSYSFIGSILDEENIINIFSDDGLYTNRLATPDINLPSNSSIASYSTIAGSAHLYFKQPYLILRYNDGGTLQYKYLNLSGTGVTWVHSTTEP